MSQEKGYFAPINRSKKLEFWRDIAIGTILIGFGIAIQFIPIASVVSVLLVVSILLLVNGLRGVFLLIRGKVIPHLRPQVIAQSVGNIIAFCIIVWFPLLTVNLIVLLGSLLLIIRGILAGASFIGNDYITVSHRRWLAFVSVVSIGLGLWMLTSSSEDTVLLLFFITVFAVLEGIDYLADAWAIRHTHETEETHEDAMLASVPSGKSKHWSSAFKHDRGLEATIPQHTSASKKPEAKTFRSWMSIDTKKYKRPLFVTPHPDDLEGFAGGLAYMLDNPVISVVMSGGNKGVFTKEFEEMPEDDYIVLRLDESIDAGKLLGVGEIIYMGYKDREVTCNEQSIKKLEQVVKKCKPDLIVSFEYYKFLTPYPHTDHIATANIVRNVVAHTSDTYTYDYLLISTLGPNCFLDVSGARKVKLEALACHTTQAGLNAIIFPIFERLFSRLWGLFTNVRYAEGYRMVQIPKMKQKLAVQKESH
jgi:LmbE family N-acetylglucosaminyl deacetylase/uncharacterized membrane protein HdeD (DUF308 family)